MVLSSVIFDLDGTILDDEDEYGRAFNKVLKNLGVNINLAVPQEKGIGVKENWVNLIKNNRIKTDKTPEILTKETQDAYLEEISGVTIRPGFNELVDNFKNSNVQIALATSNTWEQTDKILDILNLQDMFDVITTSDEVLYTKPDPDIFTVTADKLGAERHNCLVIEDSPAGVEAGRRAGMKVIAIAPDGDPKDLLKADRVIENFSEVTVRLIDQL